MKITIMLKRTRAPAYVRHSFDAILKDLEQHGRTVTENTKASRFLSYRFKTPKKNGKIYFKRLNECNPPKSLIALEPNVKLKRVSPNKVRLIYEETV